MLETFSDLSTPLDGCIGCGVALRAAPPGIRPVVGHLRRVGGGIEE